MVSGCDSLWILDGLWILGGAPTSHGLDFSTLTFSGASMCLFEENVE
jgi:hypothetical protein